MGSGTGKHGQRPGLAVVLRLMGQDEAAGAALAMALWALTWAGARAR